MARRSSDAKAVRGSSFGDAGELARSIVGGRRGDRKFPLRQVYEILRLRAKRGIGPRYYLAAGLNDRSASFADVLGHINEGEYKRFVRAMNPPDRRAAFNSKIEQKRWLLSAGIPTPLPIYATDRPDAAELEAALRPFDQSMIAAKPAADFGGSGFRAMKVMITGSELRLLNVESGSTASAAELIAALQGNLVVEPYVEQHSWYAALNPSSVNTWRIWVLKGETGAETVLSYLRIGRVGSRVDNMGAGGLYAPLRADGTLDGARDGSLLRRYYSSHPDSNTSIAGCRPPLVEEAKRLAERALMAIPALNFGGIDIALTPTGPVVIEINAEPDRMGAARVQLPFKKWLIERGIEV